MDAISTLLKLVYYQTHTEYAIKRSDTETLKRIKNQKIIEETRPVSRHSLFTDREEKDMHMLFP